ncbi:pyruvate kinase [Thermaerobacter composti]|uniref:Pyruvate kinase n=1 Tax=Thermaerobacter composti TaxID=554949 RepID=A0ABZ0QQ80_9FIRM|nr:pyruvate kinase [Thermaerobacter composti]WPD19414.1 pyruvate kinase [Thermaerobacter composti]
MAVEFRRTKIVCTLGPSTDDPAVLRRLLQAGMDVARINLSHGTAADHRRRVETLRAVARELGRDDVGILFDTRGPEVRVGPLPGGALELATGQRVALVAAGQGEANGGEGAPGSTPAARAAGSSGGTGADQGAAGAAAPSGAGSREALPEVPVIPLSYSRVATSVGPGDRILLDDGNLVLTVEGGDGVYVYCRVDAGGRLLQGKKATLPAESLDLPYLNEADRDDVRLGIELGIDFIAASFVRSAADVHALRRVIEEAGGDQWVIAKIENRLGVERLDEILASADGLMVARGDLGVELPVEEIPVLQKQIIQAANRAGKPVITATQMLESMVHHPRPTRAESTDVANAILDGTDAVMLSAETAAGRYPVEAVEIMARIARRTEAALDYAQRLARLAQEEHRTVTDAVSYASCTAAENLGAAAILTATQSGYTSRMISRYRPRQPIVALTPSPRVARKLSLVWGVRALVIEPQDDVDGLIEHALRGAVRGGFVRPGDLVVITAGVPVGQPGTTNMLQVHTVGQAVLRGTGVGQGSHTGPVRIVRDPEAAGPFHGGEVLVAAATDRDFMPLIEKAGALITEEGGLTSHAAIVGLHRGIPTIVGAAGALETLQDGETVTVDARRGLVYRGWARVG